MSDDAAVDEATARSGVVASASSRRPLGRPQYLDAYEQALNRLADFES
jgi:hypothetical protein